MLTACLSIWLVLTLPSRAGVLPPDALVGGRTQAEWTAEWWKWVFSAPTNQNPHLDTDGRWANIGQPDAGIFFLGGSAGLSADTLVRTFTVPEGKSLLVPVLVAQADNIDTDPPLAPDELRNLLRAFVDAPQELHALIDGVAVPNLGSHRAESPLFNFTFEDPDNFKTFGQGHPILGLIDPVLSDGYWLVIEPLAVGPHMLRYGGTWNLPFFFPNDIVAHITVVPIPLHETVEKLMTTVAGSNLPRKRVHPLLATLKAATKSFERDHLHAGIALLRAFQNKVRHEIIRIDPALADQFIQAAQSIIDKASSQMIPPVPVRALPPHATLFGKPMADYSADWYRYNFTLSTNQDPVHLPAGSLGDPVYFPADGFFGDPQQEHIFTIPENVHVFLPVITINVDNVDIGTPLTVEELRALGASVIDAATNLHATADGVALPELFSRRELSPVFSAFFETADNRYTRDYGHPILGLIDPIIADGYYLMLEPLAVGNHSFTVGADLGPPVDFSYRFTFHFRIKSVPPAQWVTEFIPVVEKADVGKPIRLQLLKDLGQALDALEPGHWQSAIQHLRSFQNTVRDVVAPGNPALADDFVRFTDRIIQRTERGL